MPFSHLAILKNKRLQGFIAFALREGWHVKLTRKGNIQLKKKGHATIYNAAYLIEQANTKLEKHLKNSHTRMSKRCRDV